MRIKIKIEGITISPRDHHRRSSRLKGYDYTLPGAYFVTILTHQRKMLFGEVFEGEMRLNELGEIVLESWQKIPYHFTHVEVDAFIIMPNHVHGIIQIVEINPVRAQHAAPLPPPSKLPHVAPGSLGAIVRSFKSAATTRINHHRNTPSNPVWHRNYYDRIIRDDDELNNIRNYIENNPLGWNDDEENPVNQPA